MKLIVGLGNPGEKYEKTRHNLGFMVVERFLKDFEPVEQTVWSNEVKFKSDIVEFEWQPKRGSPEKIILAKPKTYMNNSGMAVSLLTSYFKLLPAGRQGQTSDLWVVHDDVDLPLGAMKIRFGGASAGHRGVDSIIKALGNDKFWRFRMGIGHPKSSKSEVLPAGRQGRSSKFMVKGVEDFVLGGFTGAERGKIRELVKRGAKAIEYALEKGLEAAMNRFNTK